MLIILAVIKPSLNSGSDVNRLTSLTICVAIAVMCGCDRGQPAPSASIYTLGPVALPESADSIGMKFKLIPAGTFAMGEGVEKQDVTLTKPFKMGVHEVTQAQYEKIMGVNPSSNKGADNPVENVTWAEAVMYCRRLSQLPAEKQQAICIVCRPKRSGSMRAVLGRRVTTALVMIDQCWGSTLGFMRTPKKRLTLASSTHLIAESQMLWGFMTCMAMSGSGAKIGMASIHVVP